MKQNGKTLELLKKFEELGIPSIDCMVMQHGECVFRYQSGFSDVERTKPVDGSERYNLYSCSKAVTCTAAMQLVEKDIIRLDDAVYEYLPEFKNMQKMCNGNPFIEMRDDFPDISGRIHFSLHDIANMDSAPFE